MKVNDLIYSLKRPVDLIEINTAENQSYSFDGYGYGDQIPLQILDMPVMNWEVSVKMEMQSMCEVNIIFTLAIKTE